MVTSLEALHSVPEGVDDPGVVVHGDGVAAAHDAGGKGGDDVAQQPEQGLEGLGLFVPEVVIGVVRDFLGGHHLPGAPDGPFSREIELRQNRPVGLRVVAHHNGGLFGKVLGALHSGLWIKNPDKLDLAGFLKLTNKNNLLFKYHNKGSILFYFYNSCFSIFKITFYTYCLMNAI